MRLLIILFAISLQAQTIAVKHRQVMAAAPPASTPESIGYVLSASAASSAIDTTTATLVVIQCNSYGAACGSGPNFGTSDTYTAFGSGCSYGTSRARLYYSVTFTPGSTTWNRTGTDSLYVAVYKGTATTTPLYSEVCQNNMSGSSFGISQTLSNTGDVFFFGASGIGGNTLTIAGTNVTLARQGLWTVATNATGAQGDNCPAGGGACLAASSTSVTATWSAANGDEVGIAAGIHKQ